MKKLVFPPKTLLISRKWGLWVSTEKEEWDGDGGQGTDFKTQVSIGLWVISMVPREGFHAAEWWGTTEVKATEDKQVEESECKRYSMHKGGKKKKEITKIEIFSANRELEMMFMNLNNFPEPKKKKKKKGCNGI